MSKSKKVSYFNVVMPLASQGKVLEKSFVRMSLNKMNKTVAFRSLVISSGVLIVLKL